MSKNLHPILHDMEPKIDSIRVIISHHKTIDLSRNEAAKHHRTNSEVARKLAGCNDSLIVEYLEAIVTYFLVTRGKWYVFDGAFYSQAHDIYPPGETVHYISGGFRKKIVMIGRDLARARPALLLEPHDEGFFLENASVAKYFEESKGNGFYDEAQSYDRFRQVSLIDGFGHVFRFARLTVKKVKDLTVKSGNNSTRMATDFFNRSGHRCREDLSAIVEKTANGAVRYHPQEYSLICKGQRIHTFKQPPQIKASLAATYQKPQQMYDCIMSIMKMLDAEFKNHRITTVQMAAINAKVLPPPDIELGNRTIHIKQDNPELTWPFDGHFFEPANLRSWAYTTFKNANQAIKGNIDWFIEKLQGQAESRNMHLPKPVLFDSKSTSSADYFDLLQRVGQHHSFVMVITETDSTSIYDGLKLAEAAWGNVYTQHVPYSKVTEALRNNTVFDTILFQMNLKLGGINFKVSPNLSLHNGCELYPKSRMFLAFHIRNTITQEESHRKAGLTETEPTMSWANVTNALIQGVQLSHKKKCNGAHFAMPKLVIINVTRKCHRLFQSNGRKEVTNPPLGTCLDGDHFEPEKTQFLLLSDYSTKVMAYPTLYTVVHDAPGARIPLDHLEYLTWNTCFAHETNLGPLPCPALLMSAQKLSKLGRNNWFAGENIATDNFFGQGSGLMGYFNLVNARLKSLKNMFWA
ncbi:piwi domain-containing protein [Ditylenchus destructor]|nr:piwi domain-containing protein [Ditylenchus destructor]